MSGCETAVHPEAVAGRAVAVGVGNGVAGGTVGTVDPGAEDAAEDAVGGDRVGVGVAIGSAGAAHAPTINDSSMAGASGRRTFRIDPTLLSVYG